MSFLKRLFGNDRTQAITTQEQLDAANAHIQELQNQTTPEPEVVEREVEVEVPVRVAGVVLVNIQTYNDTLTEERWASFVGETFETLLNDVYRKDISNIQSVKLVYEDGEKTASLSDTVPEEIPVQIVATQEGGRLG